VTASDSPLDLSETANDILAHLLVQKLIQDLKQVLEFQLALSFDILRSESLKRKA
jgi:hypothetical protein